MNDNGKQFWDLAGLIAVHIISSLILFAAVIVVLVFLLRQQLRKYKPFDMAIFQKLQRFVNPKTDRVMLFITFLGKHQFLVPANLLLIVFFLFIEDQSWFSIRVATIALSSLVLMLILKQLFRRKRPLAPLLKAARGLSFPSGHAIMAVTFFGLIIYILSHTIRSQALYIVLIVLLFVLILLIGFSRIYLRVHYASDVVAGFIIGLCWLFISLGVLRKIEDYTSEEKKVVLSSGVVNLPAGRQVVNLTFAEASAGRRE